jgi:hypothetical protein
MEYEREKHMDKGAEEGKTNRGKTVLMGNRWKMEW